MIGTALATEVVACSFYTVACLWLFSKFITWLQFITEVVEAHP